MTDKLQVRTVRLELLRSGPPHNQLLSPLTPYLAICGESPAGVVHVPYEHAVFERRLGDLRYTGDSDARLANLRDTGIDVARMLADVPGLPGSLTTESDSRDAMIHLRITLSASELALLPFELSKVPTSAGGQSEAWLALQTKPPVCITRHIRTVSAENVEWPERARILFVTGPTGDIPFEPHLRALEAAIAPFSYPNRDEPVEGVTSRHTHYGRLLTVVENASLDEIVTACRAARYTHVHVLAHGAVDVSSKGRPFGLRLRGQTGGTDIVSGERFTTAVCTVDGSRVHRPFVVSVASCDSSFVANVVEPAPGTSFAHSLHQSGIPLVVASQFPLTKDGSVTVASILYPGLLRGENPRVLAHQIRSELHARYGARSHDWASLVVYEALPASLAPQLETVRYHHGKLRLDAALERVDLAVRAALEGASGVVDYERLEADVRSATAVLPDEGPYAMECRGLQASAMKRLAQATYLYGRASDDPQVHYARSCDRLADALAAYKAAGTLFLRNDAAAVQRVATLHWVLVQQLSLQAVLRQEISPAVWATASLAAAMYLDHPDASERAWAHASLAELSLLKLAMPEVPGDQDVHAARVAKHVREIVTLFPAENAFPIASTRKQFERYVEWWGIDPFAAFVHQHHPVGMWRDAEGLCAAASEAIGILGARAAHERQRDPRRLVRIAAGPHVPIAQPNATLGPRGEPRRSRSTPRAGAFFEVHMLPAQYGDCLWIEYGTDPRATSRVLIDCGPARAGGHLLAKIDRLPASEREVELFILTHIDDDHIGGAIPFLEAEMGGLKVPDLWFNGYRHLSELLSAAQGERFSTLIEKRDIPWNRWRDGRAIVLDEGLPQHVLPGGLRLTLLSPTAEKLDLLRIRWEKELRDKGMIPGAGLDPDDLLGGESDTESIDVDELAALPFKSDRAAPNGSSIAVLAEFEGKSALFAADAHPAVLETSIRTLLERRNLERLPVGALKVSHHASHGNTSPELLRLLECSRYLISTNGQKFKHPHRETVSRLLKVRGPGSHLYFNYISDQNKVWARPDLQERYGYTATFPETAEGFVVRL